MKHKRLLAAITAATVSIFMTATLTTTAFADGGKKYVALGDSITAGYGLSQPNTDSFPALIASKFGFTLSNEGVYGETLQRLADSIDSKSEALSGADIVTITIGGNDMMLMLYERGYKAYTEILGKEATLEEFKALVASMDASALISIIGYGIPDASTSDELTAYLASVPEYLDKVLSSVRNAAPDAVVIIETQYYPYKWFAEDIDGVYFNEIENSIIRFNSTLSATISSYTDKVYLADVYSAFRDSAENLSNASGLNLDFHPNAEGYKVIAKVFGDIIGATPPFAGSVFGGGTFWIITLVSGIIVGFGIGFLVAKRITAKK